MVLTLLAPARAALAALRPVWKDIIVEEGIKGPRSALKRLREDRALRPPDALGARPRPPDIPALARSPFAADTSPANRSSIAVLAEYGGKACLLAGDAPSPGLIPGIRALLAGRRLLPIDALKVAHHGSRGSTGTDLLNLVSCPLYLFSTNTSYYGHPDPEAVSRVIVHGRRAGRPRLAFNYRRASNLVWNSSALRERRDYGYSVAYPPKGEEGCVVQL
jgi:hypothetical protein